MENERDSFSERESLKRMIRRQCGQFLDTWRNRPLTIEELHDNSNLLKLEKVLGEEESMERKQDKQNQESETHVRHGDIEPPVREVFSNKELNRLVEVRENSPEQQNNSKGNSKNKMSILSQTIRRQITGIAGRVFPITELPVVQNVRIAGIRR